MAVYITNSNQSYINVNNSNIIDLNRNLNHQCNQSFKSSN